MPIKNYYLSEHGTLGKRLDQAWIDYQDETLGEEERKNALEFMIYVFDLPLDVTDKQALNKQLVLLMQEREEHKQKGNEHYIPMLTSGPYKLNRNAKILGATDCSKLFPEDQEIQNAFNQGKLLDVNISDKLHDEALIIENKLNYLNPDERENYNIEIRNGLFHKKGKLFDSSFLEAHGKKGYVAFTLNTNGELSVFKHVYGELDHHNKHLFHSSMNAGAPVLAAGEMEIKNGKLVSINTYSGHYEPSLYTVALFLRYLSSRGMDTSETKVYLRHSVKKESGLSCKKAKVAGDDFPWYEISAKQLVITVDQIMENNIAAINKYLNSRETKLYAKLFKSESTLQKMQLAKIFQREIQSILAEIKNTDFNGKDISSALDKLEEKIKNYIDANAKIDPDSGGRLGKKFSAMKEEIRQAKSEHEGETCKGSRDEYFKGRY